MPRRRCQSAHEYEVGGARGQYKCRNRTWQLAQEEFDRAQKPRVARLEASIPTNGFWAHWLDLSQRDPRRLDFAKNALAYLKSVTPQDVRVAATTYLRDDASWRVVFRSGANGGDN